MQKKIDVSIAPGVCTKYIQAVDVSWKKASKVLATEKLRPVVSRGRNQPVNSIGNLKLSPRRTIANWILQAWEEISPATIKNLSSGVV